MATLPTEAAIGDLPDHLPRRQGVGGWQPGDLARGAEQLARGGQTLGLDLGMVAGQQQKLNDEAQTAAAQSAAAVSHIQTNQAITNSTDPSEVGALKTNYQTNVDNAASMITDPNARQKFLLGEAPRVAQYQVGADQQQQGLVKNKAVADFGQTSTNLINAAVSTDDEGQRSAALGAISANGQSLVSRGILTPEEWANTARSTAHDYAAARVESEIARAKATGDTSRLQDLGKLFQFNPGEWGVTPPAGTGPVDPAHIAKGALAANQDQAYTAARSEGLSDTAARAVVANLSGESLATPADNHWDGSHMSQGIASWDPDRTAAIKAKFGAEPKDMSVADQVKAHIWEINNNPDFADTKAALAGSDPKAMVSALVKNYERPANPDSDIQNRLGFYGGYGARVGGAAPATFGGGTPRAVGDSLARGVGDVTGSMNAATSMNPQQVLSVIRGQDITTTHKDAAGKTITETAPGLKDADLKGPIVLSSGASNNPNDAGLLNAQLATLKSRGVDLSNVTVLGVGNRADFQTVGVNGTLQKIAAQNGARFQPIDPGMLSPDGVHPIAQGYKAIVQQLPNGPSAPAQPGAFAGVPPPGAIGPNPHLAPPQDQWPEGARGVAHNADGSLSYVMDEGNPVPIPGSRASGASGAPSPSGTGTFLDALKPQERAELGLRLQNEIGEIDRQKQSQNNQYTKAAVSDMQSRVGLMVQGRPMGPNEVASLKDYASSPVPEVKTAYATMMSIRDNLASYQGKSPADVQADVEAKTAAYNQAREQYPNSPAIAVMGDILKASQDYAKTYATEAAKQPIERAVKSGLLPNGAPAIDPTNPNVGQFLARRVSDAHSAADQLGVPIRYFQDSERPALKAVARQGGDAMVNLAENIVKSGGADAPAMFKEIGVDAPMFQKIGELAASPSGGDPETIRDIASVIGAKTDKTSNRDLPTFTDKMLSKFEDPLQGAASRFGPDFDGRTRAAANMLMTAGAERDGWDPKVDPNTPNLNQRFFDQAYDKAVGATFSPDGTKYGGIADRNAANWTGQANRVIVPNTMKANDFGGVVNSITDADLKGLPSAPTGKNGAPITADQIKNGQFEALPDKDGIFRGKYAVFTDGVRDDNHLVRDSGGKPWALDLAQPQLDTALRARNPNSYLAKTPPAAAPAPAPGRFRETPGVVATGGEGLTGAAEAN